MWLPSLSFYFYPIKSGLSELRAGSGFAFITEPQRHRDPPLRPWSSADQAVRRLITRNIVLQPKRSAAFLAGFGCQHDTATILGLARPGRIVAKSTTNSDAECGRIAAFEQEPSAISLSNSRSSSGAFPVSCVMLARISVCTDKIMDSIQTVIWDSAKSYCNFINNREATTHADSSTLPATKPIAPPGNRKCPSRRLPPGNPYRAREPTIPAPPRAERRFWKRLPDRRQAGKRAPSYWPEFRHAAGTVAVNRSIRCESARTANGTTRPRNEYLRPPADGSRSFVARRTGPGECRPNRCKAIPSGAPACNGCSLNTSR